MGLFKKSGSKCIESALKVFDKTKVELEEGVKLIDEEAKKMVDNVITSQTNISKKEEDFFEQEQKRKDAFYKNLDVDIANVEVLETETKDKVDALEVSKKQALKVIDNINALLN